MTALRPIGASALLLGRSLRTAARRGVAWREVLVQLHETGNRSAWLVGGGLSFFGVVMVLIAHEQARRFTSDITVVGPAYFELLVREFGPMISALLAAARAGAGSSAELSAMTVNEQIDALEMSAGDPLSDLVVPRLLASLFIVPALCVIGTLAASASAVATGNWVLGIDGYAFIDARFVDKGDILCGVAKAMLCGLYIPLAVAWRGLSAKGGAPGVGAAVTRGVVDAALGCLVIDFLVALAFLLVRA
ncbi:MAG: MlaE family ABC transporter permease [Myxococcota bacterium]